MRLKPQKKHHVAESPRLYALPLMLVCVLAAVALAQDSDAQQNFTPLPPPRELPVPDDTDLPSYDELPLAIRREINRPALSVLFYADIPEDRYALINGFHGHEGLPIGRELWIHEIRKDGVILRIQDRYFLLKP
jgi:hypothetical protein